MNVWRSGTSVLSRASCLTSSSPGEILRPEGSATTVIQHLVRVGERQAAGSHQHSQVVEHVRRLLAHPLVGLACRGARHLVGLLTYLLAGPGGVGQLVGRVAA